MRVRLGYGESTNSNDFKHPSAQTGMQTTDIGNFVSRSMTEYRQIYAKLHAQMTAIRSTFLHYGTLTGVINL